jgi:hypothetical protein
MTGPFHSPKKPRNLEHVAPRWNNRHAGRAGGGRVRPCFGSWLSPSSSSCCRSDRAPKTPEELEAGLIATHRADDSVGAYNLFDWRGVTPATRRVILAMIDRDLGDRLVRTMMADPIAAGARLPPPSLGFEPNVATLRLLLAEYEAADGSRHVSVHRVGMRDGVWRIALPIPTAAP